MNQELLRELRDNIVRYIRRIREWVKPNPTDSMGLTILKSIYKGVALLLLIVFSPVLCLILTIAFIAAL